MRRWRILGVIVLILLPSALLTLLAASEIGLGILVRIANQAGRGALTIGSASGRLIGPLELTNVVYDDGVDAVRIGWLRLDWRPIDLFRGAIRIAAVHGERVRVEIGPGDGTPLRLIPFSLPLPLTIDTVTANQIAVFSEGDEVVASGTGRIEAVAWRGNTIDLPALLLATTTAEVRARGQMRTETGYPLDFHFQYRWTPEGYGSMTGNGVLHGPFDHLACEAEQTTPFAARLTGTMFDLSATTTWKGRLTSERFALAEINPKWGGTRHADVDIAGQGSLDDYTLQVRGRVSHGDRPDRWGDWQATLTGNWDGLAINDLRLTQDKASLAGNGRIGWDSQFTWQADVVATHLDPAMVFPDWPGDLQVQLQSEGRWQTAVDSQWRLEKLQGTLRGFPLAAGGAAQLQGSRLQVHDLTVTSGRSALRVNGTTGEAMDLSWQLVSDNLAELWPQATGRVDARGRIAGTASEPRVQTALTGDGLGLAGKRVGRLALDLDSVLSASGSLAASVKAEKVQWGEMALDSVRTELQGTGRAHTIVLQARGPDFSGEAHLQGGVLNHGWQGAVERTEFSSAAMATWRQQRPANLAVNHDIITLQPFCLSPSVGGGLCLEGAWHSTAQAWKAHVAADGLPVALLTPAIASQRSLEGQLTASLDLNGQQARVLAGRIDASVDGLALRFDLGDGVPQSVRWRRNTLRGVIDAGNIQATLDSELVDGSSLRLEMAQAGVHLPGTNLFAHPLTGALRLQWRDLSPLTALAEGMAVFSGRVQGEVMMRGSLTSPDLTGAIELQDGQADIPQLGVSLSPLQLHLQGDANRLRLVASARSGEGTLQAESVLDVTRPDAWKEASLHVSGERFLAAALPNLELVLSPDVRIARVNDHAEVSGSILVPRARIATIDLDQGITSSTDVVVDDDEDRRGSAAAGWPVHATVKVKAGDDVRVDARGLRGRITGELTVQAKPNRPQVGKGSLSVGEGSFTLYGRRLAFDVGRLLFVDGPLTNPGIELRSEKKENGVTAGMVVEGFLSRPEVRLYSHPYMSQSAILTRLVESTSLGGATRKETGFLGEAATKVGLGGVVPYLQGVKELTQIDDIRLETGEDDEALSLVLGSWLTPNFYVSYGKNLLNESSSFNTRYLLGRGFSIKTETGTSQSGGDIKYEFER